MHNADGAAASAVWPDRYSRQIRFAKIGGEGQRRLGQSCVLIVGVGALGASLAQHMVRAGVGEVRLADRDFVEPSNLQRQMLFDEEDALSAQPKAVAASRKLGKINGEINIVPNVLEVNGKTVKPLIDGADLVLDGTDNAQARLLLSDECYKRQIPFIYGGVAGSQGMSAPLVPGRTACLRCLLGDDPGSGEGDTCDTVGVLSPAVEWVASLQAAEALKWLSGNGADMRPTWVTADLWTFRVREAALPGGSPNCPHCGELGGAAATQSAVAPAGADRPATVSLCGRDTVQVTLAGPLKLDSLRPALEARGCSLTVNRYLVRAALPIPTGERLAIFEDGRILVQGTSDGRRAEELCRLYVQNV